MLLNVTQPTFYFQLRPSPYHLTTHVSYFGIALPKSCTSVWCFIEIKINILYIFKSSFNVRKQLEKGYVRDLI